VPATIYRVIRKVSVHPKITVLTVFEQSPHNWWFEDGQHRIHSECWPCYTEHGLREHSSVCQYIAGDWRKTLWTLFVTFCIVIMRCTETFWPPCIMYVKTHNWGEDSYCGLLGYDTVQYGRRSPTCLEEHVPPWSEWTDRHRAHPLAQTSTAVIPSKHRNMYLKQYFLRVAISKLPSWCHFGRSEIICCFKIGSDYFPTVFNDSYNQI
jgi:hypothetical protein